MAGCLSGLILISTPSYQMSSTDLKQWPIVLKHEDVRCFELFGDDGFATDRGQYAATPFRRLFITPATQAAQAAVKTRGRSDCLVSELARASRAYLPRRAAPHLRSIQRTSTN